MATDFAGSADWVEGVEIYSGKIIAGGSGGNGDFAVARYNANGSPDGGFSEDGLETLDFGATDEQGNALALQADGKILVSGESAGHLAVARFLPTRTHTYLPVVLR